MATNNATNNATPNVAAHSVLISEAGSAVVGVLLGAGQVLVGAAGSDPVATTLTLAQWNDVSGTSQTAAVNNGYIISNAGLTTVTIPATAAVGSVFAVAGKGAAGWVLQMNTGQTCHYGSSATSSAGSLASSNLWDSVQIVCVTANTTFAVIASQGNLTVA